MGGWYDLTGFSLERNDFHEFIAGHTFGQYVSGLARAYAVTGSEQTRVKVNRLVKGYAETLDRKANSLSITAFPLIPTTSFPAA